MLTPERRRSLYEQVDRFADSLGVGRLERGLEPGGDGARPVAAVTGASAGVGRATAVELARRGFDVALLARGRAGLEGACADVKAAGGRALAVEVDVSDYDGVSGAADRIEDELGPLLVWVNDAMTTVFDTSWNVSHEDFRRAVEVTFLGQVWGTKVALDKMRPRDRGSIVNVGSALAYIGIPLQSAYCASKFACRGFFESTRAELLHEGSRVKLSMVHLPAVNTPQFDWCRTPLRRHPQPVPPIYQPEIPARVIVDTALDQRRSRIVGSWNTLLVALASLMPGLGNHYAAMGAWDSQLTAEPIDPRPGNLYEPRDEGSDHGAHGSFDDQAQGVLTPSFLESLPKTATTFAKAVAATVAEKALAERTLAELSRGG